MTLPAQHPAAAVRDRRHRRGVRLVRAVLARAPSASRPFRKSAGCSTCSTPYGVDADLRHRLSGGDDAVVGRAARRVRGARRVSHRRAPAPVGEPAVRRDADAAQTSYACNLGADLERDKIAQLREAIVEHLGVAPRVYKAGRYGFGADDGRDSRVARASTSTQRESAHGFQRRRRAVVRRLRRRARRSSASARRLLELPCTTGFVGAARRHGPGAAPGRVDRAGWSRCARSASWRAAARSTR